MKTFLIAGAVLAAALSLSAQTGAPASAPPKPAAVAAAPDATNQTAKATLPYPVTAIVVSNTITFPKLLSRNGVELMTNAVYRRTFGRKVIFAADLAVKSFDIDQLHPSVLAQLDVNADKAKADQAALDQKNKEWAAQNQQQNQQFLATETAVLARNQAAAQAAASNNARQNPSNPQAAGKHSGKHGNKNNPSAPPNPPPAK